MDDLTFRRTVYADPFTKDPAVVEAASEDPKKQAFWDEIKEMESAIQQAMDVPVPENLAEKLLLRQSISEDKKQQKRRPWYLAMAASVALAAVLSFSLLQQPNYGLAQDALAHVAHVEKEVAKYGPVDMQTVNAKLANYNGSVADGFGEVVSANYCYLDSIKSLHLIVKGQQGLLSLFVLPEEVTESVDESFSNDEVSGISFLLESTRIIVVGDDDSEIESLTSKAKSMMSFSA